jgi:predicted acylesterase/phospholipase RssA
MSLEEELKEEYKSPVTIKHLVITGGGPSGIKYLGIIQELERQKYFNIDNIESIYATSAGSIIAVLISLKYDDWDTLNNYVVNRPWHDAYKITAEMIFGSYSNKGLFDEKITDTFFKPLFDAKDIPLTITMSEFYEIAKIELHFFSIEMNIFEIIDINYKSFPELPLLKAVLMSSSIPMLFCPVYHEDKCYIDGALICNYPLKYCLQNHPKEEIFGIRNKNIIVNNNIIDKETGLLEYITHFIGKFIVSANHKSNDTIDNEINCDTEPLSLEFFKNALYSTEFRQELLDSGIDKAKSFLSDDSTDKLL